MGCCSSSEEIERNQSSNDFQLLPQVDSQYGEPLTYDRSFKGPLSKRSCTDVPFLIIFAIFLAAWGYIAHYAITNGDLDKILVPTDSQNRKCGVDSQVRDKPYLFFFNLEKCIDALVPINGCPTPQVCVSTCPQETFIWDTMKNTLPFDQIKSKMICQNDLIKNSINNINDAQIAIDNNRCARWFVKSSPFLKRCVWQFSPTKCEYIPSFVFRRDRRDIQLTDDNGNQTFYNHNSQKKNSSRKLVWPDQISESVIWDNLQVASHRKSSEAMVEEPAVQCQTRQKLGEEIIREKMKLTDTYLARAVGNIVSLFYHGSNRSDAFEFGQKVVEDVINSWVTILLALIFTMVVTLIFIALMRWIAAPVLWFSIFGVLIGLGVGIYYSVIQYKYWSNTPTVPNHSLTVGSTFKNIFQEKSTWMYIIILLSIVLTIIFLLVVFLRKRIKIAIGLIKEGSKAVSTVISTVFFPIFPWTLHILAIAFAVIIFLFLASIGTPVFKMVKPQGQNDEVCECSGPAINYTLGNMCDPVIFENNCFTNSNKAAAFLSFFNNKVPCTQTGCYFEKIANPSVVAYFQAYNIIGFIWLAFFISALGDMILAATFATWYWTFHKSDVPYFTLTRAFVRTVCYHLGTLAFGSLILTICRIIRIILEYIDSKLKKYDNAVTRAILCCLKCFFWCLESFLKFLNKNAYIMCAIHGKNFCTSAKDSFNLLMRNFLRVIALDKVTDFLFFLSKLLLTAAAGTATYYYVSTDVQQILHYNAVPTTIVVIGSFFITSVFFGVYSMAVDTLFLCFLEDCERNDGSPEKPYFMSKQLGSILGKRNKIPKHQYK